MNDYGFIDYQKPAARQNDYRTSTYRGNIYLVEPIPPKDAGNLKDVCRLFLRDVNKEDIVKSEIQEEFSLKPIDPTVIRNPAVTGVKYIKSYEESILRFAPKPMQPHTSVFHQDYQYKPKAYEEKPPALNTLCAVKPTVGLLVIRGKPGYAKYLDPSSTTNNQEYVQYTTPNLNLAVKDNITFWNWKKEKKNVFKIKENMCNVFRAAKCPKRRAEFTSQVKCVPNRGTISESKSSYIRRLNYLDFDVSHIKNKLLNGYEPLTRTDTESEIYGSGKQVRKYVG